VPKKIDFFYFLLVFALFGAANEGLACADEASKAQASSKEPACCSANSSNADSSIDSKSAEHQVDSDLAKHRVSPDSEPCCGCLITTDSEHNCGHDCCGEDPESSSSQAEGTTLQAAATAEDDAPSRKAPIFEAGDQSVPKQTLSAPLSTLRRLAKMKRWTI
jgi:hypothetical protein